MLVSFILALVTCVNIFHLGRVKFVAFFQSMITKPFTTTEYSRKKDFNVIVETVKFYRSQLGIPKQDSAAFKTMDKVLQDKVRRFYVIDKIGEESWLKQLDTHSGDKNPNEDTDSAEEEEYLGWLNVDEAIKTPYKFVLNSLHHVLDEMKEVALEVLNAAAVRFDDLGLE